MIITIIGREDIMANEGVIDGKPTDGLMGMRLVHNTHDRVLSSLGYLS